MPLNLTKQPTNPSPRQEWAWVSYNGDSVGIYPFDEISAI